MDPISIISNNQTFVKRFRVYGNRISFKFNQPPADVTEHDWLRQGFENLVNQMKGDSSATDQLGFTLRSLNFKLKEPGYIAFRPASEVNGDTVWDIFGAIIQSNADSASSTDTFRIDCTRVSPPVGKGRTRPGLYNTYEEECKARKGIVIIKNTDNLCLPRALVVAMAYVNKDPELRLVRMDRGKRQTIRAKELIAHARVEIPEEGAGIPELESFQEHLSEYRITVYNFNSKGRDVYFCGKNENAQFKINLLYHNGHYNVITSLTAAFVCKFFCEACHTPYDHKEQHRCANTCPVCKTTSPPCIVELGDMPVCPECNRQFRSQLCFTAHKSGVCKTLKKCLDCGKLLNLRMRKADHMCGEVYCKICKEFKDPNHRCYMKVNTGKPLSEDFLFIFFDLETRQDEEIDADTKLHKVNLCVSQQYCWQCIDGETCDNCTLRTRIFKEDPIVRFMDYVMNVRKPYKQTCVIAHNGQGFDFQFILKYVLEETKFTPELIMRGSKVILMELDNVRFIDSLNYFPMPLSSLPKAFDLPPEKKKGYFPHLFNTLANQSYVGPFPAKEYFCPESMFEKSYKDFEDWHYAQVSSNCVFDFQKEITEYCISDVDILAQACIKFRSLLLRECNVDPFLEAVTIASACNLAFRRNFLKPDTIGLIPPKGYRLADIQSKAALQWMTWEEEQRGVTIQHAGRGREHKIEGMKVDGFDGERVYEFHGCYFHGCPKCYPYKREDPLKEDPSDSLHMRYERTKARMEKMADYEVIEMWECTFNTIKRREKLTNLDNLPILNSLPLNPRDSFFGGRTGNTKTYHKCAEGEEIHYVDVCSLYPWVCKYGRYPKCHPKIHVGDRDCRQIGLQVDGLLKCRILPPRDLYHPVLPTRMHQKLMFVLCRTCGEQMNQGDCDHASHERALTGTWTMDEIRKALEKGYMITDMYELWEYEMATYDEGGLFTDFINKFLKMKQEASGYPSWCTDDEKKSRYIREYQEREGVQLDPTKIEKNGGLRSLAKLMLNSFWGKFGQRENQAKTLIVRDPQRFFALITNPSVQINHIQIINEEVILVNWENIEEVGESLQSVNVVLAAYTTAQARLKLYEHLEALGGQVLYYDTDSVLYLYRNGMYRVPTGDYLGEMTDELAEYGPGSFIMELVSGGPKTYAYLVFSTRENRLIPVCKIKGLTLNLKTSKLVNFEELKNMVLNERSDHTVVIEENRIRRTKDRDVVTSRETKKFKITGPKRKYEGEFDTLPFGYSKRPRM